LLSVSITVAVENVFAKVRAAVIASASEAIHRAAQKRMECHDARGKMISRETTSGNQTTIHDASGRGVGRIATSR
jgi:cellobiose-specific phosphotransferase system component IIA